MYEQVKVGAVAAPTTALAPLTAIRTANAEPPAVSATTVPAANVKTARQLRQ